MSSNQLPTDYQSFIHKSRYARWQEGTGNRESWSETVTRFMDNIVIPKTGDDTYVRDLEQAILSLDVMPSMRSLPSLPALSLIALERLWRPCPVIPLRIMIKWM